MQNKVPTCFLLQGKRIKLIEIQNHCISAKQEFTFVDCDLTKDNDLSKLKKIIKEKGAQKSSFIVPAHLSRLILKNTCQ